MRPWREILADRRYHRPSALFVAGLKRLGVGYYRVLIVEEGLQRPGHIAIPETPIAFDIRPIVPADFPSIAAIPGYRFTPANLHERHADGIGGLAAWSNGESAGVTWWNPNSLAWLGHEVKMEADQAYLMDAFTRREFRGMGLAPRLRLAAYEELARNGRTTLFSITNATNLPAIRFKRKLGAAVVGQWWQLKLFGRRMAGSCPWPLPTADGTGSTAGRDSGVTANQS